jgi:hypothetical protein
MKLVKHKNKGTKRVKDILRGVREVTKVSKELTLKDYLDD